MGYSISDGKPTSTVTATGKTRLQAALERSKNGGEPAVGQWMQLPGFTLARMIAGLGPDWVLIDCEHGNITDNEMYLMIGAIVGAGVSPIVRIPGMEGWMLKRALDAGAHAIMIPMCETKEQAEAIVAAMKYPSQRWPQGVRGTGGMFAPDNFHQSVPDYLKHSNDNILVIVQIESRTAVKNVEEIAAVDGIDMLFVGPNDLASSMGYPPLEHASIPEVQEATAKVLKAAKGAGKYAGHFALTGEIAAKRAKEGFNFMNCGADIMAVSVWLSNEMSKMKTLMEGGSNGSS